MPLLEPKTNIAVVCLPDQLYNSCITAQLSNLFKDPFIHGIVLKADCSDSSLGISQSIFHDIKQLKKEYPKPLIALIESICLSGAYLVASSCDYIISTESALIGGIGPSCNAWALQKTDTEKNNANAIHALEIESYQQLAKHIALNRKLSLNTTHNWAEGKIFTGTQALSLGLINETGSLLTATKVMKEKALIENDIELIYY